MSDQRVSVEEWVRRVLKAVRADDGLFDRFADGEDPDGFTGGDLVTPGNVLVRALLAERTAKAWPNLTHQARDRLLELCRSVGVDPDGKWLSECAAEAIVRLQGQVAGHAGRVAAAVAEEREACAKIVNEHYYGHPGATNDFRGKIAAAIRARSQP